MQKQIFILVTMLFLIPLLIGVVKAAENVSSTLTWSEPTQYTDGSVINAGDIIGYNIYFTNDGTTPNGNSTVIPINVNTTHIHNFQLDPSPVPYIYSYTITATAANGGESAHSVKGVKEFLVKSSASPNAPVLIGVE